MPCFIKFSCPAKHQCFIVCCTITHYTCIPDHDTVNISFIGWLKSAWLQLATAYTNAAELNSTQLLANNWTLMVLWKIFELASYHKYRYQWFIILNNYLTKHVFISSSIFPLHKEMVIKICKQPSSFLSAYCVVRKYWRKIPFSIVCGRRKLWWILVLMSGTPIHQDCNNFKVLIYACYLLS